MTAIGVAVIRARESERRDRLYDDPLATVFVEAAADGFGPDRWEHVRALADGFYEGRTVAVRITDDRFREAVSAGIRQFVLLGGGLDTRAYRMGLPTDTVVFDIDLPETFDFKEPVLARAGVAPTCDRRVVAVDLRDDWPTALLGKGFRRDRATCWVDEGSLGALTEDWNRRIVEDLTELSHPGSTFGASTFATNTEDIRFRELHRLVTDSSSTRERTADSGSPIEPWLQNLGWHTTFRSWNQMVAPLERQLAIADPRIGTIHAVRR